MARISGVDLLKNKRIEAALTKIYGIGHTRAIYILKQANVNKNKKTEMLLDKEIACIREVIEKKYKVEGDLRQETSMNIKRLMDLRCYRGLRHRKGLPVHGQRTHSNANTRRKKSKKINIK